MQIFLEDNPVLNVLIFLIILINIGLPILASLEGPPVIFLFVIIVFIFFIFIIIVFIFYHFHFYFHFMFVLI